MWEYRTRDGRHATFVLFPLLLLSFFFFDLYLVLKFSKAPLWKFTLPAFFSTAFFRPCLFACSLSFPPFPYDNPANAFPPATFLANNYNNNYNNNNNNNDPWRLLPTLPKVAIGAVSGWN